MVLDARCTLDSGRNIDTKGLHTGDRVGHIRRRQSTSENDPPAPGNPSGTTPVNSSPGAATMDGVVRIEQHRCARRPLREAVVSRRWKGHGLDYWPDDLSRIGDRFVSVQLNSSQPGNCRDLIDVPARLIDEHADGGHERGQSGHDGTCALGLDEARALGPENKTHRTGAARDRAFGILHASDSANLHEHGFAFVVESGLDAETGEGRHPSRISRNPAPGSLAVINRSPIRNARYPRLRSRNRSALP